MEHLYTPYSHSNNRDEPQAADEGENIGAPIQTRQEPDILETLLSEDTRKGVEVVASNLVQLLDRQGIHERMLDEITKDQLRWEGRAHAMQAPRYDFARQAEVDKEKIGIEKEIQQLRREKRKLEVEKWKDALSLAVALPELLSGVRAAQNKNRMIVSDW